MDLQEVYLDASRVCYEHIAEDLTESARIEAKDIFTRWQECLDALRRDPMELADQLDWVAKLSLMESYRSRDGLAWDSPKLALIDLQYCDVDPRRSLYARAGAQGQDPPAAHRRRGGAGADAAAGGHPRLLPRPGHREVRVIGGGRLLGLGDLRRARADPPCSGSRCSTRSAAPASRSGR